MNIKPVTLQGRHVRLEPLSLAHVDALARAGADESIWKWSPDRMRSADDMRAYIERALAAQEAGIALPFATIENSCGEPVGSTRFAAIERTHRRVEIGWTWITPRWQRTAVNTEAKYLMLSHAFDTWGCVRVEFKTDALNQRSRDAIRRIGAKEEGTLRKHMAMPGGRSRDSVYFSIVDDEWPDVRRALGAKLGL